MDDLIRKITKDLGVSRDQARGGVVALLRAGQQNLSPTDFKAFVADVPGADKLLKNAPPPSALSSLAGGIGSLFGGSHRALGGPGRVVRGAGRRHRHREEIRSDRDRARPPARRRRPG
jgi:hypothetical protein